MREPFIKFDNHKARGAVAMFLILAALLALGGLFFHIRQTSNMQGYEVVQGMSIAPPGVNDVRIPTNLVQFDFEGQTYTIESEADAFIQNRRQYVRVNTVNPHLSDIYQEAWNMAGVLWSFAVTSAFGGLVSLIFCIPFRRKGGIKP